MSSPGYLQEYASGSALESSVGQKPEVQSGSSLLVTPITGHVEERRKEKHERDFLERAGHGNKATLLRLVDALGEDAPYTGLQDIKQRGRAVDTM